MCHRPAVQNAGAGIHAGEVLEGKTTRAASRNLKRHYFWEACSQTSILPHNMLFGTRLYRSLIRESRNLVDDRAV